MYHFKETALATGSVILDEEIELSGRTVRYLKEFQISAVRFLYDHFRKREFCILNDESGLGKTAVAAVFLGIVATERNCLIVVDNRDERVIDWQFHLDILTDLNVNALNEEKDYDENISSVYIVKWNTLRTLGDLSKMNFDIIVLDNREQILNNTFCMSTLLRNFEKKVHLVISSSDVTSDVKLLHNILRLGGCLGHQLESFKAFEQKFHLPDLKAISNKKSDLEEYFLKREILNDYCRGFRLRRYRHQYENFLPLVDIERYKAHLAHWCETKCAKKKPTVVSLSNSNPTEIRTQELLQQFSNQVDQNQTIDKEVEEITKDLEANGEERVHHSMTASNDEDLNMSPLIYLSESDKEEEVVMLSSNSIEIQIPIIEIEDEDINNEDKIQKSTNAQVKETKKSLPENDQQQKTIKENENRKEQKDTMKMIEKPAEESEKVNSKRRARKKSTQLPNIEGMTTRRTLRKNDIETQNSTPQVGKRRIEKETDINKNNTPKLGRKIPENVKNKKVEKSTPKKTEVTEKTDPTGDKSKQKVKPVIAPKTAKDTPTKPTDQTKDGKQKVETSAGEENENSTLKRRRRKNGATLVLMSGIPLRLTRSTQRVTRSAGSKHKCFAFDFDEDKKPKAKVPPKKGPAPNKIIKKKNVKTLQTKSEESSKIIKEQTGRSSPSKEAKSTKAPLSQESVLPTPSECEEIPCGQKLIFYSSADNSPQLVEKSNEFLMPSTPPSMRALQYPLLQQSSAKTITNGSNSDILLLSNQSKIGQETITVLSSSNDEGSLSSQTSTEKQPVRQLKGQKRKRFSKRMPTKQSSNFGNALTMERSITKSPDLFSIASDVGSSNVIPFTQIHCQALTPSSNKTFGFKIFGSEVRRLQEESSSQETSPRQSLVNRSCLNILEQMFEKKNPTPVSTPTRKRNLPFIDDGKATNVSTKILATPRKPIHEMNYQAQSNGLASEDIFEITNNATFGSTLRINASGDISPVQQMNNSQHHNKITNYLIGSANAKQNIIGDEEHHLLGTPSKRLSLTQQPESYGTTRKSPKSTKSTQITKLTKWFRRSSIDETTKEILKESKKSKTTKRRRLELSFKS